VRSRFAASLHNDAVAGKTLRRRLRALCRNWAEILLPGAIGLLVWLLFTMR
jgi:hypothetical protein